MHLEESGLRALLSSTSDQSATSIYDSLGVDAKKGETADTEQLKATHDNTGYLLFMACVHWAGTMMCAASGASAVGNAIRGAVASTLVSPQWTVCVGLAIGISVLMLGQRAALECARWSDCCPTWRRLFIVVAVGAASVTALGDVSCVSECEKSQAEALWRVATLPEVLVMHAKNGTLGASASMDARDRAQATAARDKMIWSDLSTDWRVALVDSGASCMYFNDRKYFRGGVKPAPSHAVIQTADGMTVPEGIGTAYAVMKGMRGQNTLTAWENSVLTPTFTKTLVSVGRLIECADARVDLEECVLKHPRGEQIPFMRPNRRRGYVYHLPLRPYRGAGDDVRTGGAELSMAVIEGVALEGTAMGPAVARGKHMSKRALGDGTVMHHCYGHACPKRIAALHRVTTGLTRVHASDCCDCALCIEANAKHYTSSDTHVKPTEWGHFSVDHCVGLPSSYFEGFTSVLVATEHRDGWKFVVGCKSRGEFEGALKQLNAAVEALPGQRRVLSIHQDGAREFASNEVKSMCEMKAIHQTFSRPYDSNSNAIAERGIRTLFEMVRVMLLQSKLGQSFWWLAISYAVVINNLLPNTQTGYESSPMMNILGYAPAGDVIKPFGCRVVVTKDGPEIGNSVVPKGEPGVFVGLDGKHGSAGYRCLVERRSHPKISSNVVFWMNEFSGLKSVNSNQKAGHEPDHTPVETMISQRLSRENRGQRLLHQASAAVNWGWSIVGVIEGGDDERDIGAAHAMSAAETEMGGDAFWKGLVACPMVTRRWREVPVEERHHYREAEGAELEAIVSEFGALVPVSLSSVPEGHTLFSLSLLYVDKPGDSLKPDRKKVRCVFDGAREKEGVDYCHTFSPAMRVQCFRLLAAVAAVTGRELVHSDVKNGYLHAPVREGKVIYVRMPSHVDEKWRFQTVDGVRVPIVYRMDKSLYGQHESGREFSRMHRAWFEKHSFTASPAEPCLFHYEGKHGIVDVCMYIDDCVWCFENAKTRSHFESEYKKTFTSDFAPCTHFLNMDVTQDLEEGTVKIDQAAYIMRAAAEHLSAEEMKIPVLTPYSPAFERYTTAEAMALAEVDGAVVCTTELRSRYRTIIGVTMYIAMTSSPQSMFASARLARALGNPTEEHYIAARHVLRYQLHGATPLVYRQTAGMKIVAYVDSDWCAYHSTAGWTATVAGGPVLFASKKEKCVALSSTEAEIIAASMAACEIMYIRILLEHMGITLGGPTALFVDNKGVVDLARDPMSTTSMKHVKRRHFFVREAQAMGEIIVLPVGTDNNVADVLTKACKKERFWRLCKMMLGMPDSGSMAG